MVIDSSDFMYDEMMKYFQSKLDYFNDGTVVPIEFNDISLPHLIELQSVIQRYVPGAADPKEAALIKAYKDAEAAEREYNMRRMTRKDYLADSVLEGQVKIDKLFYNKTLNNIVMKGEDV